MTEQEYKDVAFSKTKEQLVDRLLMLEKEINRQKFNIKRLQDLLKIKEDTIMEMHKEIEQTAKIGEYYNKKERPHRRKDIDDAVIVRMYVDEHKSVYMISKETGWTDMTIRSRLKKLGVYEGKNRYTKPSNKVSSSDIDINDDTVIEGF